jgi:hypothetical protein
MNSSKAKPPSPPLPSYWDYIVVIPPILNPFDNLSDPVAPRFCAISVDAGTFECDWENYVKNVISRIGGFITLGVLFSFLVMAVMILVFYCCKKEKEKRDQLDGEESVDSDEDDMREIGGRYRDDWTYQATIIIPLVFLIIGMGIIWGYNIKFNGVSGGSRQELADRYALLLNTEELIKDSIALLTGTKVPLAEMITLSDKMEQGLKILRDNINFFVTNIDTLSVARNTIVIFTSVAPLVLALVGCIFLKAQRLKALLVVIFLIDLILVCTTSSFIVHGDIDLIAQDVCREFGYSRSIFKLWEDQSTGKITEKLNMITVNGAYATIEEACSLWTVLCEKIPDQVCGNYICNQDTITDLDNATHLIDNDGRLVSIPDCLTKCKNPDLRGATEDFLTATKLFTSVRDTIYALRKAQADIYSDESLSNMKYIFCQGYRDTIAGLQAGFSVLFFGQLFLLVFFFKLGW